MIQVYHSEVKSHHLVLVQSEQNVLAGHDVKENVLVVGVRREVHATVLLAGVRLYRDSVA